MLFYLKKAVMYIIVFAQRAISMAIRDLGFQNWSNQVDKVKQFYNQIMVRHGIMLVGPTGGGKTTIRSILQKALVLLPTISPADQESAKKQQSHYVVSCKLC
jgi:type II secretory ATPase GspE/PulE/Tfp pilus assembly ATPase PilB-like protein